MATSHQIKIEIPALSDYVSVVRLAVSGVAARMGFSVEDIEDLKIAISEACTNAVQHAYEGITLGNIDVISTINGNRLEIEVTDHGLGFDVSILGTKEQKAKSEEKLGLGLGLTFIKNLMDEATIESEIGKGSSIRMVKIKTEDAPA